MASWQKAKFVDWFFDLRNTSIRFLCTSFLRLFVHRSKNSLCCKSVSAGRPKRWRILRHTTNSRTGNWFFSGTLLGETNNFGAGHKTFEFSLFPLWGDISFQEPRSCGLSIYLFQFIPRRDLRTILVQNKRPKAAGTTPHSSLNSAYSEFKLLICLYEQRGGRCKSAKVLPMASTPKWVALP